MRAVVHRQYTNEIKNFRKQRRKKETSPLLAGGCGRSPLALFQKEGLSVFFSFLHSPPSPPNHRHHHHHGPIQGILPAAQPPCRQARQAVRPGQAGNVPCALLHRPGPTLRAVLPRARPAPCLVWDSSGDASVVHHLQQLLLNCSLGPSHYG